MMVLLSGVCASAQTSRRTLSAHNKIHSQQLANAKSGMDRTVISNMLKFEIEKREAEEMQHAGVSEENMAMIRDLLKEAGRHLGKPYRAGRKGPDAFDCSGFSSYVYKQFGYNISPSSRAQYLEGTSVERHSLRPGDLVFFTSRSSGNNVGHVGIVTEANNDTGNFKFIHASIKGVKVSDFAGYYLGRYIGAKRIIE